MFPKFRTNNSAVFNLRNSITFFISQNMFYIVLLRHLQLHWKKQETVFESFKKKQFLDHATYERIYLSGSQPSRLHGTPKVHKIKSNSEVPSFRPIVSSIGNFNDLSRFLCDMLTPFILIDYCIQDSFSFVKEVQEVSVSNYFMVSYDVCSLFTNIPLNETIDLAVDIIFDNNHNTKKYHQAPIKETFCFCYITNSFSFQ